MQRSAGVDQDEVAVLERAIFLGAVGEGRGGAEQREHPNVGEAGRLLGGPHLLGELRLPHADLGVNASGGQSRFGGLVGPTQARKLSVALAQPVFCKQRSVDGDAIGPPHRALQTGRDKPPRVRVDVHPPAPHAGSRQDLDRARERVFVLLPPRNGRVAKLLARGADFERGAHPARAARRRHDEEKRPLASFPSARR